jgi:hypothetical protein
MKRILLATLLISLAGLLNLAAQERIYTPELSLPENNAVDQMPDVVLDWNGVTGGNTGIIKYDVQLDDDPAFGSPVNFETEFLTAVQTANLMFGETYYWRVRAKDGGELSGWSETRSFRVVRRVVLTAPNDASTQNDTVRLQWTAMSGVTQYDYQFDTVYFWKALNSGQTANLFSAAVVDETNAWIVGAGGLIIYSNGSSWTEQESTLSTDLYGTSFLDASNGWAVGKSGKIVYFNGTDWTAQASSITTDLLGVSMLDATHGWAVGKSGAVLFYNGTSWASQYTATKDLSGVFAFDANHVWAVGKSGLVVFYNGSSWAVQETGSIKDFASVAFNTANTGWLVGKTGTIFQFKDGNWTQYEHTLPTKDLTSITFADDVNAYAVGKQGTLFAFDGIDWSSQSATVSTNFNGVGFSGTTGYLAGESGTIIAYNNDAFSSPMAVIRNVAGDKTSVKLNEMLFGTQFYWRMRAKHSVDVCEWSGARSFNTRATVTPEKPDDNSMDENLDVILQWKNQMSNDVTYEAQIDDDPAYGSPIYLSSTTYKVTAEFLKFGIEYNWRARALHGADVSDWSESWKFTTINSVVLQSPADNESNVKLSPLLTWEAQTGIAGFQVLVAATNNFAVPLANEIVDGIESSYIVPVVLDKDVQYYWKVRAVNGLDTSGWSATWSFRTMPPVGIDEPGLTANLNIYPNPVKNTVYVQLTSRNSISFNLTISDLVGMNVVEKRITLDQANNTVPVDVSLLQEGIYLIRIDDQQTSLTKKIIIKR